ncbi:MAG: ABC transporter substrate-binding protein [Dehalococcoidia bacterium]|nr:ABC transporter substrate-binding protein [Dehalococcoidia bacterium]
MRRRTFLHGSAIAAGGLIAGVACGGGDDDDDDEGGSTPAATASGTATSIATSTAQPKQGGELRLLWDVAEAHLDPHATTQHFGAELWRSASHGLLKQKPITEEAEADLATSWENPDQLTYNFKIDPRAKWQNKDPLNGRAVTAEDVVYSLQRISTPGADKPRATSFSAIESFKALDAQTLQVKLKQPFVPILTPLSDKWTAIVPREVVEKYGDLKRGESIIGCGAFICEQADPAVGVTLVRNPAYWKPGMPYLDKITYKVITDAEAQKAAFVSGQVDISYIIPALLVEQYKSDKVEILELPQGGLPVSVIGGQNDKPPFNDERLRRAINLAADRDLMAQAAFPGQKYKNAGVFNHDLWGLPPDEVAKIPGYGKKTDAELKEAADLIKAAGMEGREISLVTTKAYAFAHIDRAEAIVPQLKKIGLEIKLDVQEYAAFKDMETKRTYEMTMGVYSANGDPDTPLTNHFTAKGSRNYFGYSDANMEAMIEKQRQEFNPEARKKLIYDIQRELMKGTPVGYHGWYLNNFIGVAKKVKNFRGTLLAGASNMGQFHAEMWIDPTA